MWPATSDAARPAPAGEQASQKITGTVWQAKNRQRSGLWQNARRTA